MTPEKKKRLFKTIAAVLGGGAAAFGAYRLLSGRKPATVVDPEAERIRKSREENRQKNEAHIGPSALSRLNYARLDINEVRRLNGGLPQIDFVEGDDVSTAKARGGFVKGRSNDVSFFLPKIHGYDVSEWDPLFANAVVDKYIDELKEQYGGDLLKKYEQKQRDSLKRDLDELYAQGYDSFMQRNADRRRFEPDHGYAQGATRFHILTK